MTLQKYPEQGNISKYYLSQISGVPKTTILDICSGWSSIERCSAKTVQKLAKALNCSMEDIMALSEEDSGTGKPAEDNYLGAACLFLQESVQIMKELFCG